MPVHRTPVPSDYAKAFLYCGWKTYGLADLERSLRRARYTGGEDIVECLIVLTDHLIHLGQVGQEQGKRHLEGWLDANPEHPMVPVFRLRLVLYLNALREPEVALSEVEMVSAAEPDSASVACLRANLLGKVPGRAISEVVHMLEQAIKKNPDWMEPKLELLERLVLAGDYSVAVRRADEFARKGAVSSRDLVIIEATRIVSRCMIDDAYRTSPQLDEDRRRVEAIHVPASQQEEWHFDWVREHLIASADPNARPFFFRMGDWLKELEKKLWQPQ